jgi:hypothetical protein
MMFIKKRKLLRMLPQYNWDGALLLEALKIHKIEYELVRLNYEGSTLTESLTLAAKHNWNSDDCTAFPFKVPDTKNLRIMLVVNTSLEKLVYAVTRIINMRAFL